MIKRILLIMFAAFHVSLLPAHADANRDFSSLDSSLSIQDVKNRYGEPDYQATIFKDGSNNTSLAYNLDQNASQEIEFIDGKLSSSELTKFYFFKNEKGEQLIKENGEVRGISEKISDSVSSEDSDLHVPAKATKEDSDLLIPVKTSNKRNLSPEELVDLWRKDGFSDAQVKMLFVLEGNRVGRLSAEQWMALERSRNNIDMNKVETLRGMGFSNEQIMEMALLRSATGNGVQGAMSQNGPSFAQSLGAAMKALGNTNNISSTQKKRYDYYDEQGGRVGSVQEA